MGQVIPFRRPPEARYHAAALDRLVDEVDRRRRVRAVDRAPRQLPRLALVLPLPSAER